jgi:hypothetical protein
LENRWFNRFKTVTIPRTTYALNAWNRTLLHEKALFQAAAIKILPRSGLFLGIDLGSVVLAFRSEQ